MSIANPVKVVIISNDSNLPAKLEKNQSEGADLLLAVLTEDLLDVSLKIDTDAYIYDLAVANRDLNNAASQISTLKNNNSKTPVLITGEKHQLSLFLNNYKNDELVCGKIDKPFTKALLLSRIDACKPKQNLKLDLIGYIKNQFYKLGLNFT